MNELTESERIFECAKGVIDTVKKMPSLQQSNPMLVKFAEEVVRLNAFRGKNRWRKQSEEPAPIGEFIHVCNNGAGLHGFSLPCLYRYSSSTKLFFDYWRPATVPEEIKQ